MTEVELRKLNRAELLTMLMSLTQRCDDLEDELEWMRKQLDDRDLAIAESGTLAEAAIRVNGILEAADQAAEQYMQNVHHRYEEREQIAEEMLRETEERCRQIEDETHERCVEMIRRAREESQAFWDEVSERLEACSRAEAPLRELLGRLNRREDAGDGDE